MWRCMACILLTSCLLTNAFVPRGFTRWHSDGKYGVVGRLQMSTEQQSVEKLDKRAERRRIMQGDNYYRMGFKDEQEDVKGIMAEEFTSPLVDQLRNSQYTVTRGDVTIKLANKFGFCWGVERAVAMAYEASRHFPDKRLHITNEIIHNPQVNERMNELGIQKIKVNSGVKDFNVVESGDVVVLPAFGATLEEMQLLEQKDVKIVDTTCPWVSKVWNTVDKHKKLGATSVIHGKYSHEETVATASFAEDYIIVKDMKEAEYVCNYILNGGDKEEFLQKFAKAISKGFDPEKHLKTVGLANQTTMYKKETRAIGKLFETTMMKKFGPDKVAEHYSEFDTICDATQERQDAIHELIEDQSLDLVIVVGGWDSSNTAHLKEIPELRGITNYHIDRASRIRADGSIEHRLLTGEIVVTPDFLPKGKITVGITSGASTPDAYMQEAMEQVFLLKSVSQ